MGDGRLEAVLNLYAPPPGRTLWHGGATVLGSLRGVDHETAWWRPAPGRHSIWGLTLHVAYWKYAVLRRIGGGDETPFPRTPANFPAPPDQPSERAWKQDRAVLRAYHGSLKAAMEAFPPDGLDQSSGGKGKYSFGDLLFGIVMHDTYHAGQIQMMKRLHRGLA